MSLSTEEAQPASGSRPDRRPLAATVLMVIYHVPGLSPSTHLNLNGKASATLAQDLRAFLSWAISTGSAQLAQVNFQPLPASVVTLSQAQIAEIRG